MRCPKCQCENREGARFCNDCGNKLELACPKCGITNRLSSKFCDECGHALTFPSKPVPQDISFEEKLEKIQKYLPKGLAEKILSQRDRIEGERKQVTVMFCDMEGFTPLTERLGPEEAYDIMDQVYEILIHKVSDYEGTVNEMTGDGIMALFGAPIALEDAPQRAIRSAMAVHREMLKFSDKMKQQRGGIPPLKMRIGIHTGPVVVGTLGNDLRVEFKAVGDTVNLASRMEGLAEPGTTYVTEETFNLTEGFFRFETLGQKEVKGKEDPVNAFRVIAPSTRRTRFDVSAERGLSPFVGRERELELLLDGFERAKAGRGQAFSIVSEAGVGKSRLLYEFRKAVTNEDVTFLEGRCLSYSKGIAYQPIIDILKGNFDIHEGDEGSEIRQKVKKGLEMLEVPEESTLPYLLELLSVKDSGIEQLGISPEDRKDRILEALKRIVVKGAEIRPLIMAIEDLHWLDNSSKDVLNHLLESVPGARILLIFTYRTEFVHPLGPKSFHSHLNLNRLSARESLAIVTHLLGAVEIDTHLKELILGKAEGIAFFIEEFVKSLKALKIVERDDNRYRLAKDIRAATIPSTIQDLIMARVDTLPEGAKEVLQTGSVIAREFSYELLERVTGLPQEKLLSQLSILKDTELLYERGIGPRTTYIFKHALTQEVVYGSILRKRNMTLHQEIGKAIEELYKDSIDEHYGVLSEHFIQAEVYEKGAEYSRFIAKKFENAGSFSDALAYAEKRVTCLERLPQKDDLLIKRVDARTALGRYHLALSNFYDAKEAVTSVIQLARKQRYKRRLAQIYTILGTYSFYVEEDYPRAFELLEEAAKISEKVNDVPTLFVTNFFLGTARALNCEFEKALGHLHKPLQAFVAMNIFSWISVVKSHMSFLVYFFQGRVKLCWQTSEEALRLIGEGGDIHLWPKGMAHAAHGFSCYAEGSLREAKKLLLKSADLCERYGPAAWNADTHHCLGESCFESGEYEESMDHFEKAVRVLEQNRLFPSQANLCKVAVVRARVMNNEKDIDLDSLYGYVNENKTKSFEGWMQKHIGEILLNIDDKHIAEAEDWIRKAVEADRRNGMMLHLGWDYALYADLFKRKGDQSRAKETLTKAIEILKECGADGWVEKYDKELALLS